MRAKLNYLLIGLAFIASLHQTMAQVTNLGAVPIAGHQSLLYWPVSTTNYVLQTVTNLPSTNWLTVRTPSAVNAAAVTNSAPSGFFRLQPVTVPSGMALIPAGWFTMGDSLDGDSDAIPTNIYVSAFLIEAKLVNYGLWTNVYAYATNHNYSMGEGGQNQGSTTNYAEEGVDWFDCVKWCNARSQQAGLVPVYYTDAGFTQLFTNGEPATVYQNLVANGYRLPTEAEWEKAARGGATGLRFPWGNLIHTNQALYAACTACNSYDLGPNNGPSGPVPVGSFDVNGYKLYDMAGDVLQWCWDWYGTPYGQPSNINPTGPAGPLSSRVCRGGNWNNGSSWARCSARYPNYIFGVVGFRCVRGL